MTALAFAHTWEWVVGISPHTGKPKTQTRRLALDAPKLMQISQEVEFDVYLYGDSGWAPANINRVDFPGDGVYRRHYTHGGWLNGDVCVEPEWWDTPRWVIGRDYATKPGRTLPSVLLKDSMAMVYNPDHYTVSGKEWKAIGLANGWRESRVRILDIKREDVRRISAEDVIAEGFPHVFMFWTVWTQMHDPREYPYVVRLTPRSDERDPDMVKDRIKRVCALLDQHPADRYTAWALTFELVT